MPINHRALIGISLLAVAGAGVFLSKNTDLDGLVDDGAKNASSSSTSGATPSLTDCPFDTTEIPEHMPVIMSEISWMGDATSSNHEWIELENVSSSAISIGGWELVDQTGKIKVVFRSGAKMSAGGFYLLERGSKDFLPDAKADNFFVGIIKNVGDSFRLFDRYCSLIDEVIAGSGWPAGDNLTKRTMERASKNLAWYTSSTVGGTPKAENGPAFVKPPPIPKKASKKAPTKAMIIATTTFTTAAEDGLE
jgi:hypothetical protein